MTLPRAVLFDATDTLIELREAVGDTYARFARRRGVAISAWRLEDAFRRVLVRSSPPVFPGLAPEDAAARERAAWREIVRQTLLAADSAERVADFEELFDTLFRHYGSGAAWRVRAGAESALDALRGEGVATAIVSNFDRRLPKLLAELGLAPRLDLVLLGSDTDAAKPDPRIFAEALRRLGVAAADAVFVGDDAARDLEGARAAGIRAIDVTSLATLAELPTRLRSLPRDLPEETPE